MSYYVAFYNGTRLAKDGESSTVFPDDAKRFSTYDEAFAALVDERVTKFSEDHPEPPTVGQYK